MWWWPSTHQSVFHKLPGLVKYVVHPSILPKMSKIYWLSARSFSFQDPAGIFWLNRSRRQWYLWPSVQGMYSFKKCFARWIVVSFKSCWEYRRNTEFDWNGLKLGLGLTVQSALLNSTKNTQRLGVRINGSTVGFNGESMECVQEKVSKLNGLIKVTVVKFSSP